MRLVGLLSTLATGRYREGARALIQVLRPDHGVDNLVYEEDVAYVQVGDREPEEESSTHELATAWAYCLARELGQADRVEQLRRYLAPRAVKGFEIDPYTTGIFLLGERLETGAFYGLINGVTRTP